MPSVIRIMWRFCDELLRIWREPALQPQVDVGAAVGLEPVDPRAPPLARRAGWTRRIGSSTCGRDVEVDDAELVRVRARRTRASGAPRSAPSPIFGTPPSGRPCCPSGRARARARGSGAGGRPARGSPRAAPRRARCARSRRASSAGGRRARAGRARRRARPRRARRPAAGESPAGTSSSTTASTARVRRPPRRQRRRRLVTVGLTPRPAGSARAPTSALASDEHPGGGSTCTVTERVVLRPLVVDAAAPAPRTSASPLRAAVYDSVNGVSPFAQLDDLARGLAAVAGHEQRAGAIAVERTVTSSETVSPWCTADGASSRVTAASSRPLRQAARRRPYVARPGRGDGPAASPTVWSPSLSTTTRPPRGAAAIAAYAALEVGRRAQRRSRERSAARSAPPPRTRPRRHGCRHESGAVPPIQWASTVPMLASMLAERSTASTTACRPSRRAGRPAPRRRRGSPVRRRRRPD